MPQDDLLHPDCLSRSFALLKRGAHPVLMFSRRNVIFDPLDPPSVEWARQYDRLDEPLQPLGTVNSGVTLLARWARQEFWGNLIGEPAATVFPTELAQRLGGFSPRMYQDLDYAFWIRLIARGDVCFSTEALCSFRFHAASATSDNCASGRLRRERLRLLETLERDRVVRRRATRHQRSM